MRTLTRPRRLPESTGQTQSLRVLDALVDVRFIAALVLLLVNDHYLKAAYGNAVTGKLSDFAGLVVLPVLVTTALRATNGVSHATAERVAVTGIGWWFALMKLSPSVAAGTEKLFELLTQQPSTIIADPTDLIALVVLPVAVTIIRRPRSLLQIPAIRLALVGVALASCLATSYTEPTDYDLVIDPDTGEVSRNELSNQCAEPTLRDAACDAVIADALATEACLADGSLCFRISGATVEQRAEDGEWTTSWSVEDQPSLTGPAHQQLGPIQAQDIVVDDRGQVHVSFIGGISYSFRTAEGDWEPPISAYRNLRLLAPAAVMTTLAMAMFAGSGSTNWTSAGLLPLLGSWILAMSSFFVLTIAALALCFLLGVGAFATNPQSQKLRPWLLVLASPLPGLIPMFLWKYDLFAPRDLALYAWLLLGLPFVVLVWKSGVEAKPLRPPAIASR